MTTIMYLESLMSLSRTPFSLVDEINQGMDQRNERAVHNLLVESTCKGTAGKSCCHIRQQQNIADRFEIVAIDFRPVRYRREIVPRIVTD